MSILKKIFFLSLLLFFMTLLFWGAYKLSFQTPKTATPEPEPTETPAPTETATEKITALSDEAVLGAVYDKSNDKIKYYSKKTGQAYSMDPDGNNKQLIGAKELPDLADVFWSDNAERTITKFVRPDGQTQFFSYSYATNLGTALKPNLDEVAWGTGGNKIYYKYFDSKTKKRTLNIADPDGSNWKELADLSYRMVMVAPVPQSGFVSFWNKPDAFAATTLETVPNTGGERKTIFQEKFGADYLWDPTGNSILVSNTEAKAGNRMQLGVMNRNGGEYKNLGLPTFVSKCAWSKNSKFVYCALPGGLSDTAILPNDYQDKKLTTVDTFWRLDVSSGEKSRLVESADMKIQVDADQPFLNADESTLFFVNRTDGKLYRLDL